MAKPLRENPTGIFSLMLTPYNEDKTIDWATYEEYCDWQVEQGVEHLFAVCGSSEMTNLTLDERLKLATLTAKHKGDTTIVATANVEPSWFAQVEEVKKMSQTGVDGIVFTTKGFGGEFNEDRLVNYIGELSQYTDLPVFMYEFPGFQPHLMSGKAHIALQMTNKKLLQVSSKLKEYYLITMFALMKPRKLKQRLKKKANHVLFRPICLSSLKHTRQVQEVLWLHPQLAAVHSSRDSTKHS